MKRRRINKTLISILLVCMFFTLSPLPAKFGGIPLASADSLPSNLVSNSGFEDDLDANGQPDNWVLSNVGVTSASVTLDTYYAIEGSKSAKVTFTANSLAETHYAQLLSAPIPVKKSTAYTVSFQTGFSGALSAVNARVVWYDESGAYIAGSDLMIWNQTVNNNSSAFSGWKYKAAGTPNSPVNATTARIQLRFENAASDSGIIYIDDVNLVEGNEERLGNILPNADFERDAAGDTVPDNWTVTKTIGSATAALSDEQVLEGNKSLKFNIPSGTKALNSYVKIKSAYVKSIQESETYLYRAYLNYLGSNMNNEVDIRVLWYSTADLVNPLRADHIYQQILVYNDPVNHAGWKMFESNLTPPASADRAIFEVAVTSKSTTAAGTFYVDNMYFGKNKLMNPSFEYEDVVDNATMANMPDGKIDGWEFADLDQNSASLTVDATYAKDGKSSGKLSIPAGSPATDQAYAELKSGKRSIDSSQTMLAKLSFNLRGKLHRIQSQILFFDTVGTQIAAKDIWDETILYDSVVLSGWFNKNLTVIPPANATVAQIAIRVYTPSSLSNEGAVYVDNAYLGKNETYSLIANNSVEDILDPMWIRTMNSEQYWKLKHNVNNTAGNFGISRETSELMVWYKQTAGTYNEVLYQREFNLDVQGIYDRVIIDTSGAGGKEIIMRVNYIDTSGMPETVESIREITDGKYKEVPLDLANPKMLTSIELGIRDRAGAVEIHDEIAGANFHWIMLKKPGTEPKPNHSQTQMKSTVDDLLTTGIPHGLLFSRSDVATLRNRIKTGVDKDIFDQVQKQADAYLSYVPENDIDGYLPPADTAKGNYSRDGNDIPLGWPDKITKLSYAYVMTGNLAYADMARRILLTMADTPEWTQSFMYRRTEKPNPDGRWSPFNEAQAVVAASLGYDWIYNTLTDEERTLIRNAIRDKGVKYLDAFVNTQTFWQTNNQGLDFNGALAVGAIVINDTAKIAKAKTNLETVINNYYKPDGDTDEGMNYWIYSTSSAIFGAEVLSRYNPSWTSGLKTDGLKRSIEFVLHNISIGSDKPLQTLNFNDGNTLYMNANHIADYYASQQFQNPYDKWVWQIGTNENELFVSVSGNPVFNLIFSNQTEASYPQLPLYVNFDGNSAKAGTGYMFMRSGWEQGDDIMLGFAGGQWPAGHYHLDRNSFILEGYGAKFVQDRGRTLFSDPSYADYIRTASHNTISLNGEDQIWKKSGSAAQVEREFASPLFDFYSSEAKDAYNNGAVQKMSSFKRNIVYARPDIFFIIDEVTPTAASTIQYNLHTRQPRSVNGNMITFTDPATNSSLEMGIVLPASGSYSLMPEQQIKGDSGNTNLYDFQMYTPTAKMNEKFFTVYRPKRSGEQGMTINQIDADVREINVPGGAYTTAYGNTITTHVNTDAKFALMYKKETDNYVSTVGLMKGSRLAYKGVQLISANVVSDISVEWKPDHTVSGKIKTDGAGTVTLISPYDGTTQYQFTFTEAGEKIISNTLRTMNAGKKSETLKIGFTRQISLQGRLYDGTPSDLSTASKTFTSSNVNIATVSSSGLVTGLSEGTAEITAEVTLSGVTRVVSVKVTVTPFVIGNLIVNGGLDTNSNNWDIANYNAAAISMDNVTYHGGTGSLKLSIANASGGAFMNTHVTSTRFDIKENGLYEAKFWYKIAAATVATATNVNRLTGKVYWYDKDGYRIGGQNDILIDRNATAPQSTGWLQAQAKVVAPAGAVSGKLTVFLWTDMKNAIDLWLDDMEVTSLGQGLLATQSFEIDTDQNGLANNWSGLYTNGAYSNVSFSRDDVAKADGDYSQKYTFSGTNLDNTIVYLNSDIFAINPSSTYRFRGQEQHSGKLYKQAAYVIWYNSGNQEVGTRVLLYDDNVSYNSSTPSGWVQKEANAIAPPQGVGAVKARIQLRTLTKTGDSGSAWYDDIYFGE
ncbi:heparinase II/III family protein [Paenibacillus sp. 2RAB27]|uniref:heparinase II/III domain-containing protein n=1 Tax=Paenibacillus sp. 2RAB27 TaxID=3232991 RepID=UPI003F982141